MSFKTAIKRSKLSAPMAYLEKQLDISSLVKKGIDCLDYGCGYGFDAQYLSMNKYDPHYYPEKPLGKFNIITNIYVLNVLETTTEANDVITNIQHLLHDDGVAYITVRRDKFKTGKTTKGFQRYVTLSIPTFYLKKGAFEIYKISKNDLINVTFS